MRFESLHAWNVSVDQAREIQCTLAQRVICRDFLKSPSLIAGLDVSVNRSGEATAAAVILSYPDLKLSEKTITRGRVSFPYIPGFLSFREIPLTLTVFEQLSAVPDLVMVDGQGIAHPRRFGLAAHLGLFLDIPTIGCAKSPLYGSYSEPGLTYGSYEYIMDKEGEPIGAVLRTRQQVKPLYVSIGNKITLSSAITWVLNCCRGYRLPEPTRLAHLASRGVL
jgi:deoxyribonuclease V